jgi:dTMP kinase
MRKKSFFISVEGIDGAGKSTHISFIQNFIETKGFKVITTREPGGTKVGELIRNILLTADSMSNITELLLMFASRQELVSQVIAPTLANGICVISDRYIDASIAYQGFGRDIGFDKLNKIISLLDPMLQTDLTILFDASIDTCQTRLNKSRSKDRIEQEQIDFFAKIRNGYLYLANKEPNRIKVVSTEQDKLATEQQICYHLENLFG